MARILLIDDSEIAREMVLGDLEDLGHEVVGAESGARGLEIFFDMLHDRPPGFDVLITDINMPELSGTDVLANVLKRAPECPVIMLSSNTEMQMVRQALREGAFDYVIKDEGIEPLQEAIERALAERQKNRVEPEPSEDPVARLREWAELGADGEFIATAAEWEVHVHLQEGRVAWATSSASKYAFTRHLSEHFGIEKEAIVEVVDECRKTRKNVGETLVEWGIATEEQVRESLRAQIADALAVLPGSSGVQSIFLSRGSDYAQPLTFTLDELLP
ncbi:MAG: response regulator [Deltaproteobacteria bacterium]|nr:response regulator [Deltaproteobacteria bacterium]